MSEVRLRRAHAFAADYPERVHLTSRTLHVLGIIRDVVNPYSFTQAEIQTECELRTQIEDLEMRRRHPLHVQFAKLAAAGLIEQTSKLRWSVTDAGAMFEAEPEVLPEEERRDDEPKDVHRSFRDYFDDPDLS